MSKNLRVLVCGGRDYGDIKSVFVALEEHGFATELLRNGVDVFTVAWLGGWKGPAQVIKTYGHANKDIRLTDVLLRSTFDTERPQNIRNARKTGTS